MIKRILKWSSENFLTIFCVVVGLFLIQEEIRKIDLKTEDAIIFLEGRVADYSFHESSRSRGPGKLYHYYIWLDNYISILQVKGDYASLFDKNGFQNRVNKGDTIKFSIPKKHLKNLQEGDDVRVLSLSKGSADYLRLEDTLQVESKNYMLYIGLLFIGAGLLYYYRKRLGKKKDD